MTQKLKFVHAKSRKYGLELWGLDHPSVPVLEQTRLVFREKSYLCLQEFLDHIKCGVVFHSGQEENESKMPNLASPTSTLISSKQVHLTRVFEGIT